MGPSKPISQPRRNIVGCRIQHGWKEGSGPVTQWKGTVLDQVPVNPSLYLIKYDGFDCVYGLELHKDERVSALEVLPDRVGKYLEEHKCSGWFSSQKFKQVAENVSRQNEKFCLFILARVVSDC